MSSPEILLSRADGLLPALRERRAAAEAQRSVPDATIADLREAGFFAMLQPRRFGGEEIHPRTFFDVQIRLASACSSTAWVLGVVGVHAWQLALFDERAQRDVWGEEPGTLISSSYAPTGRVERADGGYRLTGRWSFSSGCDHCDWVFLGGFVPVGEGERPDMRTFLLPRSDYQIDDDWHTMALQGTGSRSIVVDGMFVPEHRTHKMTDGFRCRSPGNRVNTAPLYRVPFGQIFVRSVSTSAIGIARGALDFYREVTASKVGAADGARAAASPAAQTACARAASTIDQCELVLSRNMNEMMRRAEAGAEMTIAERAAWRWDSSEAVERCVAVVDELFALCGARALFLDSPMQRFFRDIHGARAHYANRSAPSAENLGRLMLGGTTRDWFI